MDDAVRVLVVEDESASRKVLEEALAGAGYLPTGVRTATDAVASVRQKEFAVVLLDLGLPDGNGLEACARVRGFSNVPIIIISARGEIDDVVRGLEAGADDYMVKPFDVRAVMARVHAQIRRSGHYQRDPGSHVAFGSLVIDFEAREAFVDGAAVGLTVKEFDFLAVVARAGGKPVSKYVIHDLLWDEREERAESILTVYARKIRKKIESDPDIPRRLLTVRGLGYRLGRG